MADAKSRLKWIILIVPRMTSRRTLAELIVLALFFPGIGVICSSWSRIGSSTSLLPNVFLRWRFPEVPGEIRLKTFWKIELTVTFPAWNQTRPSETITDIPLPADIYWNWSWICLVFFPRTTPEWFWKGETSLLHFSCRSEWKFHL